MKTFSPAPVSTTARTSSRSANDRAASPSASNVASSSALTGGLSTVAVATASETTEVDAHCASPVKRMPRPALRPTCPAATSARNVCGARNRSP